MLQSSSMDSQDPSYNGVNNQIFYIGAHPYIVQILAQIPLYS